MQCRQFIIAEQNDFLPKNSLRFVPFQSLVWWYSLGFCHCFMSMSNNGLFLLSWYPIKQKNVILSQNFTLPPCNSPKVIQFEWRNVSKGHSFGKFFFIKIFQMSDIQGPDVICPINSGFCLHFDKKLQKCYHFPFFNRPGRPHHK